MATVYRIPSFAEEEVLWAKGIRSVAGLDEVGRGALAGPVAAAAVILPPGLSAPWLSQVRDSKLLTPKERERLYGKIREAAVGIGIGVIPPHIIDRSGIARATRLAMKLAIKRLCVKPETLLIDYFELPEVSLSQKGVADGDTLCFSIACASIVAKVFRDSLMVRFDCIYPGYCFSRNKGYGTEEHLECLRRLGPSPIHRFSFQPLKGAAGRENEA